MENKDSTVKHFDKIFRLMSTLCLLIVFITIWSIVDLVDYKKNSQLFDIAIATFGIVSSVYWLAIWKKIEYIKKFIIGDNV
jgi:hypothetical protein